MVRRTHERTHSLCVNMGCLDEGLLCVPSIAIMSQDASVKCDPYTIDPLLHSCVRYLIMFSLSQCTNYA